MKLSIQLGILHFGQHLSDNRARRVAQVQNVLPGNQLGWPDDLRRRALNKLPDKFIGFQVPIAGKAVQAMQSEMLVKLRQPNESLEGCRSHALYILKPHMMFHKRKNL